MQSNNTNEKQVVCVVCGACLYMSVREAQLQNNQCVQCIVLLDVRIMFPLPSHPFNSEYKGLL